MLLDRYASYLSCIGHQRSSAALPASAHCVGRVGGADADNLSLLASLVRLPSSHGLLCAWQLRGAALASSHTPLLAFSKGSTDKNRSATGGGMGTGGSSAFAGSRDKTSGGGEAGGETGGGGEELGGGGGQMKGKDVKDGIDKDGGAVGAKKSKVKEGDENLIVIHVCDENRGINRDFTCRKVLLCVGDPPECMCLSVCRLSLLVCSFCW